MRDDMVVRKNPDMVTREINHETILLPVYKTSDEINCIYTLNRVASQVWKMLDGKKKIAQLKKEILVAFDTTQEEVDKEMAMLLKDLREIKAIL